jgi:hypothetical protein
VRWLKCDVLRRDAGRENHVIWGAAIAALLLGLALGVVVHEWTLLLIPLLPFAGMLVLAATGSGTGDWSRVLPVAFLSGTAPMALGMATGILLIRNRELGG